MSTRSKCPATAIGSAFLRNLGQQDENGKEKDGCGGENQSHRTQGGAIGVLWFCVGAELQGRAWLGEPIL